ncbi:MAG: thioredoxin family protein [Gammaproteobacteria bacterium]|nr:thioredoxin family protein [Gammaproteobacteria bacterium]
MAETPSTMIPLGSKAPDFTLFDTVSQQTLSLQNLKSTIGTVIMFLSNHCPYVKHIQAKLIEVAKHYQKHDIVFIAINSNDVTKYPADSPQLMQHEAQTKSFSFPYLYDETQATAKAYRAACTPDFYIFDGELNCVYRGRFDDATPGNGKPVTGRDLTQALDSLLHHEPINPDQKASLGCNIKWKT